MDQIELFRRLAVALAIGLMVGLERGWQTREEHEHRRVAGLRTYALSGLSGGIAALVAAASGPIVLAAALVSYTGALALFSYREAMVENNLSVTGVVAGILTFLLGAYAMSGNEMAAVAAGVAMAGLLALREPLHDLVRKVTWLEMRSALALLAMTFLLLPILPNRAVDPWGALNPAEIWLLAILIAAVSFAGYVAVRVLGEKQGIAVAAVAGGLTSSTATTVSFARLAREHPGSLRALSVGVLLSGTTMLARILVLALALKPELAPRLLPAVAAAALVQVGGAVLLSRGGKDDATRPALELRNPFDMVAVLQLGAIIAVIMLAAKLLARSSGAAGVYGLAAVSGIADVDALTLSMARFAEVQVPLAQAVNAILIAAGVNTVSKTVMAGVIGGRRFGFTVGVVSLAAVAAMALAAGLAG